MRQAEKEEAAAAAVATEAVANDSKRRKGNMNMHKTREDKQRAKGREEGRERGGQQKQVQCKKMQNGEAIRRACKIFHTQRGRGTLTVVGKAGSRRDKEGGVRSRNSEGRGREGKAGEQTT